MKPRIFIGSSSEGMNVAFAIQENLDSFGEVTVWNQGIFKLSDNFLSSLLQALNNFEYAILVYTPDDSVDIRGEKINIPRDNVVFETGLFMGKLGKDRVFFVSADSIGNFRILSDLAGISHGKYDSKRSDLNYKAALAPFCNQVKRQINDHVNNENNFCGYLVRYAEKEEPVIYSKKSINIDNERAYNLLLYMFNNEIFNDFRAFDLAFNRWEELIQLDLSQTFNISFEIFEAMNSLLMKNRCTSFKRILVIDRSKLSTKKTFEVLSFFKDKEDNWNKILDTNVVQTKIYIYSEKGNSNNIGRIKKMNDFALFSGSEGQYSIIETTLTSPNDFVNAPVCQVNCESEKNEFLNREFDAFWDVSKTLESVLGNFYKNRFEEEQLSPKKLALDYFLDQATGLGNIGVVIEGGYFDLRDPNDHQRYIHLEDAFWLKDKIQNFDSDNQISILLESFINDFSTSNICQYKYCDIDIFDPKATNKDKIRIELVNNIKSKYKLRNLNPNKLELFGMRNTRNRISKYIKKLIKETDKIEILHHEEDISEIILNIDEEQIILGYLNNKTREITVRCTALMAQHYFDLYQYIKDEETILKNIWIFDFNKTSERMAVKQGAKASIKLFQWPENLKLNIINCIYDKEGNTGTVEIINN